MWKKEEVEQLVEVIKLRRSVRVYKKEPLSERTQERILQKAESIASPLMTAPVGFQIVTRKQIRGFVPAKAPHYIALYARNRENDIINAAFIMEQLDLWLIAHGIGTCWLGLPNPKPQVAKYKNMPFVILLAFGRPNEMPLRKSLSEFKRKTLPQITNITGEDELLLPLQLAPSASNRQPWYVTKTGSEINLYLTPESPFARKMLGSMPYVDMGIALCHLWLSAMDQVRFASFEKHKGSQDKMASGVEYIWSMKIAPKAEKEPQAEGDEGEVRTPAIGVDGFDEPSGTSAEPAVNDNDSDGGADSENELAADKDEKPAESGNESEEAGEKT